MKSMNNKKKILWISPYAPYNGVAHGGGKTHNFYIKYFQKSGKYDITLFSLCLKDEKQKLDLDESGIKNDVYTMDENPIKKFCRRFVSGWSYINPFDSYGGICLNYERYQINKILSKYIEKKEKPDIVILQWTFALMFIDKIKKYFPQCKIIAIEEDVTFLNYERRYLGAVRIGEKLFYKYRFNIMKKVELDKLNKAHLIVTNNPKDTQLLIQSNILSKMIFTSAPYIETHFKVQREDISKNIFFLGAMSRRENYSSAIWFIKYVLPLIDDEEFLFFVVGGNPHSSLYKYSGSRVVITGYVEDVEKYFSECVCMVAPLVGGAGIKIKVLEAMSAGVPVLTNDIGIEGIMAVDGRDYFHCSTPEEYATCLSNIMKGKYDICSISENAKKFIKTNYNLSEKLNELMRDIEML